MHGLLQHYYSEKRKDEGQQNVAVLTPSHVTGPLKQHQSKQRQMAHINWREKALRRRKVADCQIIGCVVTSGLLILTAGLTIFLAAWFVLGKDDPLILIGPVLAGCGVIVLLMSVEVCVRRQKVIKLTDDLSSDEEDGHYIDEGLVNYGFGNYKGIEAELGVANKSPSRKSPIVVRPQSAQGNPGYRPNFDVEGRLRPEDRPQVNVLAPTPEALEASMTQESIEMLLSPKKG